MIQEMKIASAFIDHLISIIHIANAIFHSTSYSGLMPQ